MGVLHLRIDRGPPELQKEPLTASLQRLATAVADHVALAFANIKLREALQTQAIHDPLTGLFNRRYMTESLEREIRRADRRKHSIGLVMMDIDHFKRFNDLYGHDAGDTLLRELGNLIKSTTRGEDIACRYGGEEFMLVLPETTLEGTGARAEHLRTQVKHLNVQHRRKPLGPVGLSLGIACYPAHGATLGDLVFTADAALYRAKAEGRDRVVTADAAAVEE